MQLTSALAIYFIIWWMVLFTILPIGARSAHEAGEEVDAGTMRSAPLKPRIGIKFLATTVVASIVFAGVYYLLTSGLISLDDIPLLPDFKPKT